MRVPTPRSWIAGVALAMLLVPSTVAGQTASGSGWPARPVTIVSPFAAGIAPDIVTRMIAQELSEKLGQRFVVENRAGASGNIGAQHVAQSPPDGYTLLLSTPYPVGFNKLMQSKLQFDPEADFAPVVTVAKSPQIFVAGPQSKARNLRELMDLAKARPGALTAGIPGIGTTSHIAIEALLNLSNTSMAMVPYRGSPPVADLLSGQLDIGVGLVPSYVGSVNGGQIVALAVSSSKRSEQLPNVPTAEEAGFPGFEATGWYMLVAPKGTPQPIIERLNGAVNDYIRSEKGKRQFYTLDLQAVGGSAQDAKAFIASEMVKWASIIKKANIKL